MLLANILLSICALISLLIGLFILISNPRKPVNRALSAFLFAICIWLGANLATNLAADPHVALWLARTTLIGACALPYTFLMFCKIFTHENGLNWRKAIMLGVLPFIIVLTFPTKLNIVSIGSYGKDTVTGAIYFLLTPLLIGYFTWGVVILNRYYRRTKLAVERAQLRYIFTGLALTLIPTLVANAILPSFGVTSAILYAPSAVIFLAVFTSIAIVKHRLLDIRLVVARSLAYILVLSTAIGLYTGLTFGVATQLLGDNEFTQRIFPLFAALFLAFTIQPLQKFFNRVSNKFFYRDAYDAQLFLDNFNKILVSTYDLEQLLKQSAETIELNLKPAYCVFSIRRPSGGSPRIIGTAKHPVMSLHDIDMVRDALPKDGNKVLVAEQLDEKHEKLQRLLQSNDISAYARLGVSTSKTDDLGYLLLGPKKSGNLYSSEDTRIIEIIANELVIAIQNALRFEEIENFNVTLQQRIDEATHKLRRANEKLKALDETKDDFISMASHQLRTPLTSVKGYLSMILEGDVGKITPTQKEMIGQAFSSSQRMVYLIADLLNVSRLKTGKFVIEPKPVNLADLVEQELSQLDETAKTHSLDLSYMKPKNFPELMLDETKTRQVVMNFVDNAIYYTPVGGKITVKLAETPSHIELRVEDNGIGVPKQEQPHLFTKFYRAGNARKARPDGTGLGLFMAKKVIIAQGGALIFESHQDKGSVFGFSFSKHRLAVPKQTSPTDTKQSESQKA